MHKVITIISFIGLVIFSIYASTQYNTLNYSVIIFSLAIITSTGVFVYPKLVKPTNELKAIRLRVLNLLCVAADLNIQDFVKAYRKNYQDVDVTTLHSVIYDMIDEKSLIIENEKLKIKQ